MRPLSHSSISLYLDCPKKWHFKYVEKIPEKPRHFFSFGKSVHDVLEYFYDVRTLPPPSLEQLLKRYEDKWLSEGYESPEQEAQYKEQGRRILEDYYRKHIDGFKIPYFTEYGFQLKVDDVPVVGYVDRIDKVGDDRIAIVDYKTGKAIPKSRVLADEQLTMYQMACEQLLGLKVENLTFYHLPSQTALTVGPHREEQVEALREKIVKTAEQIKAERFLPKPEERKCGWCDYKALCPAWSHKYAEPQEAAPAEEAPALSDEKIAKLVDRYGQMRQDIHERELEAERLKEAIVAALKEKGYVRAFGERYQASVHLDERWEFSDKKKILDTIQRAGYWEQILAPSAPAVQKLMKSSSLPLGLLDELKRLGKKVDHAVVRVKKIEAEDG